MIVVAALFVASLANATASGALIDIGPGAITFDELAARLTHPDLPVRCDLAVKDRVAFVYLRQRSREEIERLCEQALGAEFAESKDRKSKVLRADPEVLRRDTKFASILAESVRSNLEQYGRAYQSLTVPLPAGNSGEEQARVKGDLKHAVARKDRRAVQAAMRHLSDLSAERDAGSIDGLICMQVAAQLGADSWRRALIRHEDLHDLSQPAVAGVTLELIRKAVNPKPDSTLTCHLMVTQTYATLGFDLAVSIDNAEAHDLFSFLGFQLFPCEDESGTRKPLVKALFDGTDEVDPFRHPGFGNQARVWLENKRKETTAFLGSGVARREVSLGNPRPDSLAQLVAEWCRLTDVEAIVELQPRAEALGTVLTAGAFDRFSWASRMLPQSQWSFDLADGVLLATNLLGFLERQAKTPLATLIRCERATPSQPGKRRVPTVQMVAGAGLDGIARTIGRFDEHQSRTYRGFELDEFDDALDVAVLFRALDSATRTRVSSLGQGEIVRLPVSRLQIDPAVIREILLHDRGLANAFLLSRDSERLAHHELVVSGDQRDPSLGIRLKLAIDGAKMGLRWFGTGTRVEAWYGPPLPK